MFKQILVEWRRIKRKRRRIEDESSDWGMNVSSAGLPKHGLEGTGGYAEIGSNSYSAGSFPVD